MKSNQDYHSFIQEQITYLFNEFKGKKLCELFAIIEQQNSDFSPNIRQIQEKVSTESYASVFDFALDVRYMILNGRKFAEQENDKCMRLGLIELNNWFDKKVRKSPRNNEEKQMLYVRKLKKQLEFVKRGMCLSAYNAPKCSKSGNFNEKEARKASPAIINDIQKLLKEEAVSADVQMMVIHLLKKHIPDFKPSPQTTLEINEISYKCAKELKALLLSVKEKRLSLVE